jgi:transcriptional regulator with XRE-family HTH domain
VKTDDRDRARLLRREQGLSVKQLARMLGVSQSTVSLWFETSSSQRASVTSSRDEETGPPLLPG